MNGHYFLNYYLLADNIYSMWTIFVQTSYDCWGRKGSGLHNNKRWLGKLLNNVFFCVVALLSFISFKCFSNLDMEPKKLDQKSHPNPLMVSNFVMVSWCNLKVIKIFLPSLERSHVTWMHHEGVWLNKTLLTLASYHWNTFHVNNANAPSIKIYTNI